MELDASNLGRATALLCMAMDWMDVATAIPFTRPGGASWAAGDGRDGPAAAQRRARACGPAAGRGHLPGARKRGLNPDIQLERIIEATEAEARHAGVPLRVEFDQPGIDQARFSLDQGAPLVSVPASDAFADAEARASSVVRALTHANLHRDLAATCRTVQVLESVVGVEGPPALAGRQPDSETLQRLRAYEADRPTSLDRRHLDMADLAVDCAAMQRLTGLGLTYHPSPDAVDPDKVERQAAFLERPGAMSRLSEVMARLERRASPTAAAGDPGEHDRERPSPVDTPPGGVGDPGGGAPERVPPRPSEQLPTREPPPRYRLELPGADGPGVEPRPLEAPGAPTPDSPPSRPRPPAAPVRPSSARPPAQPDRPGSPPRGR